MGIIYKLKRRSFLKKTFVYSCLTVLPFLCKIFSQTNKIETFVFGSADNIWHNPENYFNVHLIKKWKTYLKVLKNNSQLISTNKSKCVLFSVEFASILDKDIFSYLIHNNKNQIFKKKITSLNFTTNCLPYFYYYPEDKIIYEIKKRNICV